MTVKIKLAIMLSALGLVISYVFNDWQICFGFSSIALITILLELIRFKRKPVGFMAISNNIPDLLQSFESFRCIPPCCAGDELIYTPNESANCGHNFKNKWPQRDNLKPGQSYTVHSVNPVNGLISLCHTYGPGYYQHPSQFVKSVK